MHLTPREVDKLILHQAGFLAQKRLARGVRLNYVEAVALIATQLLEFIRDGRSVADLMDLGRRFLGTRDVLDGVPEMLDEVQVEGTFPDGTKLVTVHNPSSPSAATTPSPSTAASSGRRRPRRRLGAPASALAGVPGEVLAQGGEITLNDGRDAVAVTVANTGDRPIQVGSHYHFFETNRALAFDRGPPTGADSTSPPAPRSGSSRARPRP